jgi:uracil-DNA glycosylase
MDKAAYLNAMHQAWSSCQGCMLSQSRNSVVFGYGNPDAQILVVGEAPGRDEDLHGVPFIGVAGQLLDQYLASVSINPRLAEMCEEEHFPANELREILLHSIFFTNVVACRPPENRDPTPGEIATCITRLREIIYVVDPVLIIGVGRISVEALLGHKVQITKDRGTIYDVKIPGRLKDSFVTYPMLAVLHTSYLMRQNDFNQPDGMGQKTFQDFLHGMHIIDWFNWLHHGVELPKERTPEKERDK